MKAKVGRGAWVVVMVGLACLVLLVNLNRTRFTTGPILWDMGTGKELATLKGHTRPVISVAYSPDGKTLASGCQDKTIKLWDLAVGNEQATLEHAHGVASLAFSPDGKTLASASDDTIKLWEVATRQERATFRGHAAAVTRVAYSPDGKTLASGSMDNTIKLWDVATEKELATLKGHTAEVISVAYSSDGKTLASVDWDGTIKLWDVTASINSYRTEKHPICISAGEAQAVAFSASANPLVHFARDQFAIASTFRVESCSGVRTQLTAANRNHGFPAVLRRHGRRERPRILAGGSHS